MNAERSGLSLDQLFAEAVSRVPTSVFLAMEEGNLTFVEADEWSGAIAGGLADAAVTQRDIVALVASNGLEVVVTWLACLRLGAAFAPLNAGFTPTQLAHVFKRLRPPLVIAEPDHVSTVDSAVQASESTLSRYVLHGTEEGWRPWEDLEQTGRGPSRSEQPTSKIAAILCTSGTTGMSKAVGLSDRWFTKICESNEKYWGFRDTDIFYCPFPLYHMDAMAMTVVAAIYHGTTAAIARRFSVKGFWSDIRKYEATVFDFLGTTLSLLWKEPPRPDDNENPARLGWGVPMPEFQEGFEQRFGCDLIDCYGSTDVGIPIYGIPGESKPPGSCGRVVDGYEVAILDDKGRHVGRGEVGEICMRPLEANIIMEGYVGDADATLDAWRGLWHHTGDRGSIDSDGYVYFMGRAKEYIRRRGENISVLELEAELARHPDLVAVAAVGVPSDLTEEDIKVVAVSRPGSDLTPAALGWWLRDRLPRYMTVRYVELVGALPTTETAKVVRRELVDGWNNRSTWDVDSGRYLDGDETGPER